MKSLRPLLCPLLAAALLAACSCSLRRREKVIESERPPEGGATNGFVVSRFSGWVAPESGRPNGSADAAAADGAGARPREPVEATAGGAAGNEAAPQVGENPDAGAAQEAPQEPALSMREAVAMALKENLRLAATRLERERARGRIGEAWATALPNIRGTVTYTRKDEIVASNFGGMSITSGDLDNWNAEITVRQNLSLWTSATAIAVAKLYRDWTEEQVRASEQQTTFLVKKLYLDLLLAMNTLDRNEQTLALAREHAENIKKLRAQGVATEFDVLRATVQVANTRALGSQARSAVNVAMISLVRMLGLPYDARVQPIDALEYLPLATDVEFLIAEALSQRSEMAQARLSMNMQEKNVSLIEQEFLPTLSAQYSYGNERPNRKGMTGKPEWEDYWFVGVTLSYPLFEGGLTRSKLIKESAVLRQQELAYRDTVEGVKAETYQAVLGMGDAAEFVESQAENVRQAEESVRLAQVGYQNGANTSLEVLDAQTAFSTARTNYLQAVYSHCVARIALEKALGR